MTIYMVLVLVILLFFGQYMWDLNYSVATPLFNENGTATDKGVHYTIIFNTFIFMTLFNEINCRMVGAKQFNVFHNILRNWIFIVIVAGTAALQYFFV
jgi:Ca2+ transporting ATPase